jgi:hypothetical protein
MPLLSSHEWRLRPLGLLLLYLHEIHRPFFGERAMFKINRKILCAALALLFIISTTCAAEELKFDHAVVSYSGIDKAYANAIGRIVSTARDTAVEKFAFEMPDIIRVEVNVDADGQVNLFNDGADHIFLTIRSQDNLLKPGTSGVYEIYGLCHEVGHMAMYRLIPDHSWLTGDGAEGWAHYMGSRLVDAVYAKQGADLWPDRYDYLEDGTKRLDKQLSSQKASSTSKTAGAWKKLAGIVGDKKIAPIFKAWGQCKFDPADPGNDIGKALSANAGEQAGQWWNDAEDSLILKRAKSKVASDTAEEGKLSGKGEELAHDDGKSAGQNSFAGGGHAVRFEAPNDSSYITEARIYGARYGLPAPPKENFHVWLCDKDFKVIADNQFPYSKFPRGNPRWVALKIKPTRVPREFIVCAGFNPTATKGVYVHYDAEGSGHSLVGLPGGESSEDFDKGDWMIRVTLTEKGDAK